MRDKRVFWGEIFMFFCGKNRCMVEGRRAERIYWCLGG